MKHQRIASTAGLAACALLLAVIATAANSYTGRPGEHYTITNHFISELGRRSASPLAPVFNAGLVVAGALLILFAMGLRKLFLGWARLLVGALALTTFVSCSLIGFFPVGKFLVIHLAVASVFFPCALALALCVSGLTLLSRQTTLPAWTAVPGLLVAAAFTALLMSPTDQLRAWIADPTHFVRPTFWPLCVAEWACLVTVLLWLTSVSIVMRKRGLFS